MPRGTAWILNTISQLEPKADMLKIFSYAITLFRLHIDEGNSQNAKKLYEDLNKLKLDCFEGLNLYEVDKLYHVHYGASLTVKLNIGRKQVKLVDLEKRYYEIYENILFYVHQLDTLPAFNIDSDVKKLTSKGEEDV